MDWDFWTDPFQVDDDSYYEQYLHFGRQHFIENDALNVASCIQVLRILISNADTEIEGLEKDLLSLQNELACAENEKWHEICCSALTERINLVDVAISTLKNDHADDTEVQLLLHNKAAETLHEIVQALQRDHCRHTIGQQLDVNTLNPVVNDTDHALDKDCSSVDSNMIVKEEGKELYGTSENSKGSELLLELHEKRSNDAIESLAKSPVASPNLGAIICVPLQVVYPQELCPVDTELCSFKGSDGDDSRQMMRIENTSHIDAENFAPISVLKMQTKSALHTGLQLTDEGKQQAQGLKFKSAANLSKANMSMSFPSKLTALGKRKAELEAFYSRELLDRPTEVDPNTSIVVPNKRQRKSKISTSPASLNLPMNRKITKRAVPPRLEETVGRAIVPYDSEFSEFQKKMSVSKWPITAETQNSTVNSGAPNSDKVSVNKRSQVDLDACKSRSLEGSRYETSALQPNNLKGLTLINLRALAKQHNLKKYSKLPKAALIELLIERLYNS